MLSLRLQAAKFASSSKSQVRRIATSTKLHCRLWNILQRRFSAIRKIWPTAVSRSSCRAAICNNSAVGRDAIDDARPVRGTTCASLRSPSEHLNACTEGQPCHGMPSLCGCEICWITWVGAKSSGNRPTPAWRRSWPIRCVATSTSSGASVSRCEMNRPTICDARPSPRPNERRFSALGTKYRTLSWIPPIAALNSEE